MSALAFPRVLAVFYSQVEFASVAAFPKMQIFPQLALPAVVDIPAKYNHGRYKHVNRAAFATKYADFKMPSVGELRAWFEEDGALDCGLRV